MRVLNVTKAPVGWAVFLDGVRIGVVYATKEAALEGATVVAAIAVRDGDGVQINVPSETKTGASWPKEWDAYLKTQGKG